MEKELFSDLKFLVTINDGAPSIMCERHAKMFEMVMTLSNIPHTIYELDSEDSHKKCQACNLSKDISDNMPKIILPGEQ